FVDYPSAPGGFPRPEEVWFGSVYRSRNAAVLEEILAGRDDRRQVHLWALDEVSPRLASLTRGSGPGGRFELLQRLLDECPPSPASWAVFSDDDYRFRRGSLGDLVSLARAARLDLVQPAHRRYVNASFQFNLVRPRLIARRTHFVEIGPVVLMSPRAQAA